MNNKEIVAWARGFFPTVRRHVVRWVYTDTGWYGLYLPGIHSDTILVNAWNHVGEGCIQTEWLKGTLLHELIHCEQNARDIRIDHGAYFRARREELMQITGVFIPPGVPS